jgi:membrane fusion protein (multidrug efflux system)
MWKRVMVAVIGLIILAVVLGGIKGLQIKQMITAGEQAAPPPETVTCAEVQVDAWESRLTSVGTLTAVQGVMVTSEVSGKVARIAFDAGTAVRAGDLLVQQDITVETAQLHAARIRLELAETNFKRARRLLPDNVISQSDYDRTESEYKQAQAELENIQAVIAKKTIRAPFDGRLGIRLVNLGQTLNEGDPIVSLQTMDPIFVDFTLPQQQLTRIEKGYSVEVTTDMLAGDVVKGRVTAINPQVDEATRNIRVQATLDNPRERLRPGMFVQVAVILPEPQKVLAIPATAVLHAPYSDSVFVIEDQPTPAGAKRQGPGKVVRQQFVKLGEKRGDYIAVQSGLEAGQRVVSTGVFKLRNGQAVVVDNTLSPEFKLHPKPENA